MITLVLGFLLFVVAAVVGALVSEEVRGWLDMIPQGILSLDPPVDMC